MNLAQNILKLADLPKRNVACITNRATFLLHQPVKQHLSRGTFPSSSVSERLVFPETRQKQTRLWRKGEIDRQREKIHCS